MPREGHDNIEADPDGVFYIFQSTCPARGTTIIFGKRRDISQFQSTCPARGTTRIPRPTPGRRPISIHVPREGHDGVSQCCILPDAHFNPRAPRGARLNPPKVLTKFHVFQSTCPARGTTDTGDGVPRGAEISIHVPREGHDWKRRALWARFWHFNPRAPRGARHCCQVLKEQSGKISIHVPREGHDAFMAAVCLSGVLFQSTCPARGTTATSVIGARAM